MIIIINPSCTSVCFRGNLLGNIIRGYLILSGNCSTGNSLFSNLLHMRVSAITWQLRGVIRIKFAGRNNFNTVGIRTVGWKHIYPRMSFSVWQLLRSIGCDQLFGHQFRSNRSIVFTTASGRNYIWRQRSISSPCSTGLENVGSR